ncbi:hypothetical protein [Roseiconus lacunae]|uniref:hypothetical protein n=1 Tax=Roseiconus lacunae TaxID=2605694 RepID=UPI0011F12E3F|nr:hypothetical protein [Roseiconus lacunae]
MNQRAFRSPVLILVILVLCVSPVGAVAAEPAGRWVGSWNSQSTGHRGALRARIRQVDEDTYRAWFAGRFAVVVPFVYPAKLERVPGTSTRYRSDTRLPLMGNYRMTADIGGGQFRAVYHSRSDRGMFIMNRR